MDRSRLTDDHIKALAACVEIATPYDDDEIEGPTSDEHNSEPFEQWSPDRIAAVASIAVDILRHMKATGQLDLPTT